MKLLIITQKIDVRDPVLGFFHRWMIEFAKHYEKITVICLEKGDYDLPENVRVLSLGKEKRQSRFAYLSHFYSYVWKERKEYDAVFVHMNQEYILLAGWLWKMLGKKIYMWRNHHAGTFLTDSAVSLCTHVFCTSKFSYTAKYEKTIFMPVGIDIDLFKKNHSLTKKHNSLLFLGRIAPIKKPDILIDAIHALYPAHSSLSADIIGDPLPKDNAYYDALVQKVQKYNLGSIIAFHKGIPHQQTVDVYNSHEIFVNLSTSGMYDKTIFEAMACQSLCVASNDNLIGEIDPMFIFKEGDSVDLGEKLSALISLSAQSKEEWGLKLRKYVEEKHSLVSLGEKLARTLR